MDAFERIKLRKYFFYSFVFLVLLLVIFSIILFFRTTLTGKVTFSVPETLPGAPLEGSFELNPKEVGRPIPIKSLVRAVYPQDKGEIRTLYLYNLLSKEYISKYSKDNLLFGPDVQVVANFIPSSFNGVQGSSSTPDNSAAPSQEEEPPLIPPKKTGGIIGHVTESTPLQPFSKTYTLYYGKTVTIPIYQGYSAPKIYSVTSADQEISKNYISLTKTKDGYVLSSSYYQIVTGIPLDAPPTYFELSPFDFKADESDPITVSLIYPSGQAFFSLSSQVTVKNVAPLKFATGDRVLVNSEDIPTEITIDGKNSPTILSAGPIITSDLIAAGCKSFVCNAPSECSIPSLDTINRGILVSVQKSSCRYTDCGTTFEITKPCDSQTSEVSATKVSQQDLGSIQGSSSSTSTSGPVSSVVLSNGKDEKIGLVTSYKKSSAVDFTFFQSPPILRDLCKNGVLDEGEKSVDCGGSCAKCSQFYPDYSIIAIWLGTCVLGMLFFILVFNTNRIR